MPCTFSNRAFMLVWVMLCIFGALPVDARVVQRKFAHAPRPVDVISELVFVNKVPFGSEVSSPGWGEGTASDQSRSFAGIRSAATSAGVPDWIEAVFMTLARIETGVNPWALHSQGACGLFQFRLDLGVRKGLTTENCLDPLLNARAAIPELYRYFRTRVAQSVQALPLHDRIRETLRRLYAIHLHGPNAEVLTNSKNGTSELSDSIALPHLPWAYRFHAVLQKYQQTSPQDIKVKQEISSNEAPRS